MTVFLISHSFYTRIFLNGQYETHNRETVKRIWSQMPYIEEVGKTTEPLIFYFEGDGTNETILRDSVTFGFPTIWLYSIKSQKKTGLPNQ